MRILCSVFVSAKPAIMAPLDLYGLGDVMGASCRSPLSFQLIHYRDQIQSKLGLDTSKAQQHCASLIGAQTYSWQAWESASEQMPPELWQLFKSRACDS